MRRYLACWLGLALLAPLLSNCGAFQGDACADLACVCADSGFRYQGQCVKGERVCECPDQPPHALECPFTSCSASSGTVRGSWKLVGACPHGTAEDPACGSIAELRDAKLSGLANLDSTEASFKATGTLVTEYAPHCAESCTAIEASIDARDVRCAPGGDGIACRCDVSYALRANAVFAVSDQLFVATESPQLHLGRYCQSGDSLTLSTDAFDLAFERAGCIPNEVACGGDGQPLICGPEGEFVPGKPCLRDRACSDGVCVPVCEPQSLYCHAGHEYRCTSSGLALMDSGRQDCADGVACVNGAGCQGARKVELGSDLQQGSLDGAVFVGEVLRVTQDATLLSYSVRATTYGTSSRFDWRVYEATTQKGLFQLIFEAKSTLQAGGGDHETPPLSLPVMAGRYYMLGVSVDPTTIFQLGGVGESGSYATPLGITWSQREPVDGFAVNALSTEPGVLIGRALFEP
ncbi:MAG TPA: hypothetical protein VHP33_32065 [Polyangiaceae bacterium]|nr:hypothetical protein [Polyangiaceae bacterium]